MKNYKYKARTFEGSMREGNLIAVSRKIVLKELREQGLVAVRIEEASISAKKNTKINDVKAFIIIVAVLIISILCFTLGDKYLIKNRKKEIKDVQIKNLKVNSEVTKMELPKNKQAPNNEKVLTEKKSLDKKSVIDNAYVSLPSQQTTAILKQNKRIKLRPKPKEPRVLVPGIKRNDDPDVPDPYLTFVTKSERLISQILQTRPGDRLLDVGLGNKINQDFLDSLNNTIEIYPTDSEEMAAHKEDVAWMKQEIGQLVAEGKTPEEIFASLREQHNEIADRRDELARQYSELKKVGSDAEIQAFVDEANSEVEALGARPFIFIPRNN